MTEVETFVSAPERARRQSENLLLEWLDRVRSGEVIAVALAGVCSDHASLTAFSPSDRHSTLIGTTAILQGKLLADVKWED